MINLMLYYLRRPTCKILGMSFHFKCLKLHFDGFISFALARASEKRQAAFLGVVRPILLDDLGIEHNRICRDSSAFIKKGDDALKLPYHIGGIPTHPSLCAISMSSKSCAIYKILFHYDLRLPCKEYRIVHKFFNHWLPRHSYPKDKMFFLFESLLLLLHQYYQ